MVVPAFLQGLDDRTVPKSGRTSVNNTAAAAKVTREMVGGAYRLRLNDVELSRTELLELEQRTRVLPIACVEGWTTTQT